MSGAGIATIPIDVVDYIDGCALMFNLRKLDSIGTMNERLFMYFEDTDWCYRAKRLGFSLIVEPKARVWHKVGRSVNRENVKITYWFHRNRVAFEKIHASSYEWICFWAGFAWNTLVVPQLRRNKNTSRGQRKVRALLPVAKSLGRGLLDGLYGASIYEEEYKVG